MRHLPPIVSAIHNGTAAATTRRGFTLIELLVAITVMMIILGGGIAGYLSLNERQTLLGAARELQQVLRSAQKKARVGDKPTGCNRLDAYTVRANGAPPIIVELQAVCDTGTFSVDTSTLPNSVSIDSAINMQFAVLHGGVTNPQTVTMRAGERVFSFNVNAGGEMSEGDFVTQ